MEAFTSSKPINYHILYNYVFCQLVAYYIYLQYSKISTVQKYITILLEYLHGNFLDEKKHKIISRAEDAGKENQNRGVQHILPDS